MTMEMTKGRPVLSGLDSPLEVGCRMYDQCVPQHMLNSLSLSSPSPPYTEELLSLLSSGLTGVAEEELEEVLGRSRSEDGTGGPPGTGGGRESRVSLYEFSDPLFQVLSVAWVVSSIKCISFLVTGSDPTQPVLYQEFMSAAHKLLTVPNRLLVCVCVCG